MGCNGLFQTMYVSKSKIDQLKAGIELSMPWAYPQKNFFNVSFANVYEHGPPLLHTKISLGGNPANYPAVWPDPTPKFQVRQNP